MVGKSKETQEKKRAEKNATSKKGGESDGKGGKAKKKKWSKGRIAEKANNKTFFDKGSFGTLTKTTSKKSCITVYSVMNDLKVRGSLAKQGIRHLVQLGLITPVSTHSKCMIFAPVAGLQTTAKVPDTASQTQEKPQKKAKEQASSEKTTTTAEEKK